MARHWGKRRNDCRDDYVFKANVEAIESLDEKQSSSVGRDYAGTAEKTDPIEIKLVRKLDWRIMVGASCCAIDLPYQVTSM